MHKIFRKILLLNFLLHETLFPLKKRLILGIPNPEDLKRIMMSEEVSETLSSDTVKTRCWLVNGGCWLKR